MKLIEIQQQFFKIHGSDGVYFCTQADTDASLNVKAVHFIDAPDNALPQNWQQLPTQILRGDDLIKINPLHEGLGMAYRPVSEHANIQHLNTPDSMGYETHEAMKKLKKAVGGDTTNFVCERLQWSRDIIKDNLFAEQIDAVALILYNFEARHQAVIIGDQTGIGKGRVAASIIRYAMCQGLIPVFCTESANLFTDIYRDLSDIGCGDLVPFIMNSDAKANITVLDENDKNVVVYRPIQDRKIKNKIFKSQQMPYGYDYILATYSQLKNAYKKDKKGTEFPGDDYEKYEFLTAIADNAIFIFDESHNIAGSKAKKSNWWDPDSRVELTGSNQFKCFNELSKKAVNTLFLSATFAKQPQNMIVYANRTCIQESGLKDTELIDAISKGNEALQEIISANIVSEGQMIHREGDFSNVCVNYFTLDGSDIDNGLPDLKKEHCNQCDYITNILNEINLFEQQYVMPIVEELNNSDNNVQTQKTNEKIGAMHTPLFSKLFNIVNQLLFAIKAEAVADHAINLLKQGKKVVIAVSSTMEAFIDKLEDDGVKGEVIPCDFALVLDKALQNTLTIVKDGEGDYHEKTKIPLDSLPPEGQDLYFELRESIVNAVSNICISPLDLITQKIEKAINPDTGENFIVTEVTGRSKKIEFTNAQCTKGRIVKKDKVKRNIAFSQFQNNQSDVLIINKSGSTGASAHATTKNTNLKPEQVKPRVMIIAQAELDISTEVQKRGRINRTGQIASLPPRYDYISSAIPAEKRLMMMLQKKLKSLDANTTSNQKQSKSVIDVPDFFNKYGDMLAYDYLVENPDINLKLNDVLNVKDSDNDNSNGNSNNKKKDNDDDGIKQDFLKKVSGWVPLLTCEEQKDFYDTILSRYTDLVAELKKKGEYDLEVEALDLDARLVGDLKLLQPALKGDSCFSDAVYQGVYSCKVLQKPFTQQYISMEILNYTKGEDAKYIAKQTADEYKAYYDNEIKETTEDLLKRCEERKKTAKDIIIKKGGNLQDVDQKVQEIVSETEDMIKSRTNRITLVRNRARYIEYFYAGRACIVDSDNNTKAICLGVEIGNKTKNKFAPSNIKVSFAVASNVKELDYTLVDRDITQLDAIKGLSISDGGFGTDIDKQFLLNWNDYVKESSSEHEQRVIIVGNLLRGYQNAPEKSKLISFTTHDGKVLKGILTPKNNTDNGAKLIMSKYDINDFAAFIKDSVSNGENKTYYLERGMKLCTNATNEYSQSYTSYPFILYCEDSGTFKRLKTIKEWQDIADNGRGFEDYTKDGKKHYVMQFKYVQKLEELISLLDKYKFKVELYPSEAQRIFGKKSEDVLKHGNWKPLETHTEAIPKNKTISPLLLNAIKLASLKNGGSPLSGMKMAKIKPIGKGFFGNIYDCFKGKVKEAVNFLITKQDGDLLGVFHRKDIGDIDLVWGDEKMGLKHILTKHINDKDFPTLNVLVEKLSDVVNNGIVKYEYPDRYTLEKDGYWVAVKKVATIKNVRTEKTWVITAYNKKEELSAVTLTPPNNISGGRAVAPDNSVAKVEDFSECTKLNDKNILGDYSTHVYGSLKREDFVKTIHQGGCYQDGWEGIFGYRYVKSAKEIITKLLKYFYPEIRFSIKINHRTMTITVISSPCAEYNLDDLLYEIELIANGFNYDKSDAMVDYFDNGFYLRVEVSDKYQQNDYIPNEEFTVEDIKEVVSIIDKGGVLPMPKAKTTSAATVPTATNADLQIVDYSDKAIVLTGDTKPLKDQIKKLGGKFGSRFDTSKVPSGIGWLFPKTKLAAVQNFVAQYGKSTQQEISPLLANAIKLAALKNGGSPLSGVYNRMPNKFWRLEDRFFPTDEKLKKIYDNICKSGKLSVTLLQQLKLYSNDTRRNINQISGIIGKNDRTYVGALLLRGSTCGHRTSSFGILSTGREAFRRRELQQQLFRQFAELEGIWYKSKEDFITKNRLVIAKDEYGRDIAGTETKVYHDPLCNLVYKFLRINANSNYLYDNLLERIIVHNLMFGDKTALYIEGFFFDDNFISIAVSQPFIKYAHRLTKEEQRDKFFEQFTHFTRTNKTCIVNDDLVVYDLHNNNVLVDDNGEYYVIDCYAKFFRKDDLTNHYNYENVNSTLSGPYVSETSDSEGHSIKIGDIVAFPKAEYGGKTFLFGVVKSIKLMEKEHSDVGVFLIKRNKKMLCFDKEYYRENNLIQYVTNTGQYDEASLIKSFERCVNDYFASTYEKDKSLLIKTIHDDINTAEYRLREYKADMKRYDNYAKHLSWQEAQSYFHAKLYADTYQEWINNVYSSPLLANAIKLAALKNE